MNQYASIIAPELIRFTDAERERIMHALDLAVTAHGDQKRASGEPFVIHPLTIATRIARVGLDADTVVAALLHDIIEDCEITPEKVEKEFGAPVRFLVESVSKLGHIRYSAEQRKVESLRRMFLAIASDVRVVIIKLYDRLHNMETIHHLPPEKQIKIARETLELYAPLAYRLGFGELKGQLEDLAFPIVYPEEYKWVVAAVEEKKSERERYLKKIVRILERELEQEHIPIIDINTRAKHYYSLWKKLLKYDMNLERIYDLSAVRVVVPDIANCYSVLGIIHKLWKPLPGRIKDYIALPKPNGYRSIHSTVIAEDERIIEIQIRTKAMHNAAENGVAAHWAYEAAGKTSHARADADQVQMIDQLREWQKHFKKATSEDFVETLKIDFFQDRIFVLTPRGEVIDLPEGATPIDFAYHIHSDIGNRMTGAKVNGKLVNFQHPLKSGDTVEILTQKGKKPSADWISYARTSVAREHIRTALRRSGVHLPNPVHLKPGKRTIEISVKGLNRKGLLKDVSQVFSDLGINIDRHASEKVDPHVSLMHFTISYFVGGRLEKLLTRIRTVEDVREVTFVKRD